MVAHATLRLQKLLRDIEYNIDDDPPNAANVEAHFATTVRRCATGHNSLFCGNGQTVGNTYDSRMHNRTVALLNFTGPELATSMRRRGSVRMTLSGFEVTTEPTSRVW